MNRRYGRLVLAAIGLLGTSGCAGTTAGGPGRIATPPLLTSATLPPVPVPTTPGDPTPGPGMGLAPAQRVVGRPIVAGSYVFYLSAHADRGNTQTPLPKPLPTPFGTLYAGNMDTRVTLTLTTVPLAHTSLAADSTTLAWIEQDAFGNDQVRGYRVDAQQEVTLLAEAGHQLVDLALDSGVLYYQDQAPAHRGLYARILVSGQERRISAAGRGPVAADGTLLWSEVESGPVPAWSLHLLRMDGSRPNTVLTQGQPAGFSGYHVAGDYVVWAAQPPAADLRPTRYTISTGQVAALAETVAYDPYVAGQTIIWTEGPLPGATPPTVPSFWAIRAADLATGRRWSLAQDVLQELHAWGIVRNRAVPFTVLYAPETGTPGGDFYVFALHPPGGP